MFSTNLKLKVGLNLYYKFDYSKMSKKVMRSKYLCTIKRTKEIHSTSMSKTNEAIINESYD